MPDLGDPHPDWPPGVLFKPTYDIGWQYGFIAEMHLMGRAVLAADMGLGKAQPVTEPVHTPNGFVPMGKLVTGDLVTGASGQPTMVIGVFPQGERQIYRVTFSDGSWTRATGDHLWQVQTCNGITRKYYEVKTTEDLMRSGLRDGAGNRKYRIPVTRPVRMTLSEDLPLDPYLLGLLIGDGSFTQGSPGFTTIDNELVEELRLRLPDGITAEPDGKYQYRLAARRSGGKPNPLATALKGLGLWGHRSETKFIPRQYLTADLPDRLALFQGLMDTDGYYGSALEFSSSSRQLTEDVLYLVQSFGGVVRGGIKEKETPCLPHYRIIITLPNEVAPFRLRRKATGVRSRVKYYPVRLIESIEPDGFEESQCIKVDAEDCLYLTRDFVVTHNTVMALGTAAVAFEFGLIDLVVVVCEKNKLTEWVRDFGRFTRLAAELYYGPKRKKVLGDLPRAIVTTYETARTDAAVFPPKGSRSRTPLPGVLMEAIGTKRVMLVYDEVTKIGHGRDSKLYKAHAWLERQLRASCKDLRVIALTGTPMETDLDGMFNELRIVLAGTGAMPTVKEYEERVVRSRDIYGRPTYRPEGREWFRSRCEPYILRKRKSDPDVRDQFPPLLEEFRRLQMHDDQYKLYRMLEDLAWTDKGERQDVPGLNVLLRLMAGDPLAVLESAAAERSELAVMVAEELGADLERCSSAKAEELASMSDIVMSGGGKLMVFTFFARTVLPVLERRLGDRPVFTYHGGMTQAERDRQLALFEACEGGAVLLASDAAHRGINVPFVDVIAEYEPASKHSTRVQRANRGHRLGRANPLTFVTLVLESTIESTSNVNSVLSRNADQDFMLRDDEADGFTTADDRRELYAQARPRKAG
jgi:hypothetical protein